MRMMATKKFKYGRRDLHPGDLFEAPGRDARVLVALNKAREQSVPAMTVESEPALVKPRTYKRRDLRAEK